MRKILILTFLALAGSGFTEPAQDGVVELGKAPTEAAQRAKAAFEKAQGIENLEEAAAAYREAARQDPAGEWGLRAALELGRQEYALGRPEAAMMIFDKISEDGLEGEAKAQLLYWRAQSRLSLKGFQKAQDDFESFLKAYPGHALADSASLAVADCDSVLGNTEAAVAGYQKLYQDPPSSVASRALFQAALLQQHAGHPEESRKLLEKLSTAWPDSMEASRAKEALAALPQAQASPVPSPSTSPASAHFSVQVGAYARRAGAEELAERLKKKGYQVRLDKHAFGGQILNLVQVGYYESKAQAQKAALRMKRKEGVGIVVELP
jgi:TolA-binding protein